MAQFNFGPIYCETPDSFTAAFPVEPAKTLSNAVIVMFGVLSLYYVIKRAPRAYDLYVLSLFMIANGIGSGLWHGFRDRTALIFEVQAGLLVLFGIAFCWARRIWSSAVALLFTVVFLVGFSLSQAYWGASVQRWVAIAPIVIAFGAVLISQTAMRSKKAALLAAAGMASSLTALGFRTYDLEVCSYFPLGTHFLWHIFNSGGAFLTIFALIVLQTEGAPKKQARPLGEAAE